MTKQFHSPHPRQDTKNPPYHLYLKRDYHEKDVCLLQWLRNHSNVQNKSRTLAGDKYLVAVKFVSLLNPVFPGTVKSQVVIWASITPSNRSVQFFW